MYICCKSSNSSLLPQSSYRIFTHYQTTQIPKNTSKFTFMKCHIKQEQQNEKMTNFNFSNFFFWFAMKSVYYRGYTGNLLQFQCYTM